MAIVETIEYGQVRNSKLVEIFGDDVDYNSLEECGKNPNDTTRLKVRFYLKLEIIIVWFDEFQVMRKEIDYRNEMTYLLNELKEEKKNNIIITFA